MSMPTSLLLVKDDGARLVFEPELSLNLVSRLLEGIDADLCAFGAD